MILEVGQKQVRQEEINNRMIRGLKTNRLEGISSPITDVMSVKAESLKEDNNMKLYNIKASCEVELEVIVEANSKAQAEKLMKNAGSLGAEGIIEGEVVMICDGDMTMTDGAELIDKNSSTYNYYKKYMSKEDNK